MSSGSVESVDAIIVVGPVLWKCVNCNLLVSRHHSIDKHLQTVHASRSKHKFSLFDSLHSKCDINGCSCCSLADNKLRNGTASAKKEKNTASGTKTYKFLHDRRHIMTVNLDPDENICEDVDEIPQASRDNVKKASTTKQKDTVDCPAVGKVAGDDEAQKVLEQDNASVEFKAENNSNTVHTKESSCEFKDDLEGDLENYSDGCEEPKSGSKRKFSFITREDSDCVSANSKKDVSGKLKGGKVDYSELPSLPENSKKPASAHLKNLHSQGKGQGKRTSGRANKGKNSLYGEYRMDFA